MDLDSYFPAGTVAPWIMCESTEAWDKLLPLGRQGSWPARETIYGFDDPADEIVLITGGLIKIVAQGLNGNLRSIGILGPGSLLGEAALFSESRYRHLIICVEAAQGVTFSRADLGRHVLGHDSELTLFILRNLAHKSYVMSSQLECASFMSGEQLIAHFLYHLYLEQLKDSWIYHKISPLPLTTLAELIGLHRVTLTRIVGDLIRNGIIGNVERKLRVNDADAILKILCS